MRIHCTEDQHSLISFWFFFFQQNSIFYYLFHPTGHGSILNSHFVITQNVITIYFYILIFLINKLWFLLDLNWLRFDMNWNEKYLLRRIYIDVSENFLIIIISLRWNEKKKNLCSHVCSRCNRNQIHCNQYFMQDATSSYELRVHSG